MCIFNSIAAFIGNRLNDIKTTEMYEQRYLLFYACPGTVLIHGERGKLAEHSIAYIDSPFRDFSLEGITEICMNITLHLLGLDGDDETRLFLYNRIAKNTIAKPKSIY